MWVSLGLHKRGALASLLILPRFSARTRSPYCRMTGDYKFYKTSLDHMVNRALSRGKSGLRKYFGLVKITWIIKQIMKSESCVRSTFFQLPRLEKLEFSGNFSLSFIDRSSHQIQHWNQSLPVILSFPCPAISMAQLMVWEATRRKARTLRKTFQMCILVLSCDLDKLNFLPLKLLF